MNEWMFVAALVLGVPIALAIWLIGRAVQVGKRLEELSHRLSELEKQVFPRKPEPESERPPEPAPAPGPSSTLPAVGELACRGGRVGVVPRRRALRQVLVRQQPGPAGTARGAWFPRRSRPAGGWSDVVAQGISRSFADVMRHGRPHSLRRHLRLPLHL